MEIVLVLPAPRPKDAYMGETLSLREKYPWLDMAIETFKNVGAIHLLFDVAMLLLGAIALLIASM